MKKFEIIKKTRLAENVCEYKIFAPLVVKHAKAGQFVILRVDSDGERVPFTICDYDKAAGTVSILVQEVGYTTKLLGTLHEGDALADFVGPLGNATDLSDYKRICLIGGGIGAAVIYPQSKELKGERKNVDAVIGARNQSLIMYEDEFKATCDNVYVMTDDGSYGEKGFVTDKLKSLIESGKNYDCVFAVGPLPMMKAVAELTRTYGIKTVVSMNSLMVDGTGMCGCCRLTVDGEVKYACIDGPEFDGHAVDFDESIRRNRTYVEAERACNLRK